jgi:WD40 repeat protein
MRALLTGLLLLILALGSCYASQVHAAPDATTPLHQAVDEGRSDIVRLLLSQGADVNGRDSDGSTPLHLAASRNNEELVKVLIDKGADVNARDNNGRTPLHLAARNNNKELILLLLSKGAYPFEMDNTGAMALDDSLAAEAPEQERLFRIKEGFAAPVSSLCFSPGSRFLVSGGEDGVLRMWSPMSGKLLAELSGHGGPITCISFSRGGSAIASGSLDGTVILWDWSSRTISRKVLCQSSPVMSLCFSCEGKYLICGCDDGSLKVWNAVTRELIKTTTLHGRAINALCISPDNRHIVTGSEDGTLISTDFPHLEKPVHLYSHSCAIRSLCFSGRGTMVASGDASGEIILGALFSRAILKRFKGHDGAVESILYSPGGRYLVSGSREGTIKFWDTLRGNKSLTIYRGSAGLGPVRFSPGGRFLAAGGQDGTISIIDSIFGTLRATLVGLNNGEWISMTPDLYFDSSLNGAHFIMLHSKGEAVTLDQYWTPRRSSKTVKDMISGRASPVKALQLPDPPEIRILAPSDGESPQEKIILRVETRGACRIKDLLVLVNGRPSRTAAINEHDIPAPGVARELTAELGLQPGLNRIDVIAISSDEVKSRPETVNVHYLYPSMVPSKRLFLLAVGVNDYGDRNLNLDCAALDAREMEAFFKRMKGLLFEEVKTISLIDSSAKDLAIIAAIKEIGRESTDRDLVVLFFAGHGAKNDRDEYFFLCHGGRRDSLPANALCWNDFQALLAHMRAKNVLLVTDVCHSGSIFSADTDLVSNENLAEGMIGVTVFAACRGNEPSCELPTLGGVFTQTLLSGLGGKASTGGKEGTITLFEAEKYVSSLVPRITGDRQHPMILKKTIDIPLSVFKGYHEGRRE